MLRSDIENCLERTHAFFASITYTADTISYQTKPTYATINTGMYTIITVFSAQNYSQQLFLTEKRTIVCFLTDSHVGIAIITDSNRPHTDILH